MMTWLVCLKCGELRYHLPLPGGPPIYCRKCGAHLNPADGPPGVPPVDDLPLDAQPLDQPDDDEVFEAEVAEEPAARSRPSRPSRRRSPLEPPSRRPAPRKGSGWVWWLMLGLGVPVLLIVGCCGVGYWWTSGLTPLQLSAPRVTGGLNMQVSVDYAHQGFGLAPGKRYVLVIKSARGHVYTSHVGQVQDKSGNLQASGFGNFGDDGPFEIWVESESFVADGKPRQKVSNVVSARASAGGFGGPMGPIGPIGPVGPQGPSGFPRP